MKVFVQDKFGVEYVGNKGTKFYIHWAELYSAPLDKWLTTLLKMKVEETDSFKLIYNAKGK